MLLQQYQLMHLRAKDYCKVGFYIRAKKPHSTHSSSISTIATVESVYYFKMTTQGQTGNNVSCNIIKRASDVINAIYMG